MTSKIVYVFPSRERPERFFKALDNLRDMSESKDYEIWAKLDLDDPAMCRPEIIEKIKTEYPEVTVKWGLSQGKIHAVNRDCEDLPECDIIIIMSDDIVFDVKGFDSEIKEAFQKHFPGYDGTVHFPEDHAEDRTIIVSMIGINLYKKLGYLYNPIYTSVYADNDFTELTKLMGKYVFINRRLFSHPHPGWNLCEWDALYRRNESANLYQVDGQLFKKRQEENFGLKLQLPSVTLICIDSVDANRAIKVLEHCKSLVDFGAVKLLTHIPVNYEHRVRIKPLNSLIAYSIFMLTKVHEYIDTEHLLIVQRDGWILNPQSFDRSWLQLDFIGPLFIQYDRVGSGGFSMRSKRLMQYIATKEMPEWNWTQKQAQEIQAGISYYEDGICSLQAREGFKIASVEQAANYAQGGNLNPTYFRERPFGFHRTWQEIDFKTGLVDSSDLTKDLHVTYDHEIDSVL
jgi:hypothetical protein